MTMLDTTSGDYDYTYLSLGAGVQSSALLVLACTDERVPKPDVAIFADTGDEPAYVYSYLKVLAEWAKPHGVDVVTVKHGVLSEDIRESLVSGTFSTSLPLFTTNEEGRMAIMGRQCTRAYKIAPIRQKVRELLGYKPRQRVKHQVRGMIGISLDEIQRMKESNLKWITNSYPLVDLAIRRGQCREIVQEAGLPEPQRSACYYCPYHSDSEWVQLRDEYPDEFAKAVEFDGVIRDLSGKAGAKEGLLTYLHSSCVPLGEVDFKVADPNQQDLFNNECEGMCGV